MARSSYSAANRFTSDQTGATVELLSTSYTSKTGRVAIIATAPLKTSRYTSYLFISVNNVTKPGSNTNEQNSISYLTSVWAGDIGTSPVTIKSIAVGQDTGTNVTIPQYKSYTLLIFDI